MRALRYDGPSKGVILQRDAPEPVPGEGEALIRTTRASLSRADALFDAAPRPDVPPITLGRRFVGVVERVGGAAGTGGGGKKSPLIGARVAGAINVPCGACDLCRKGLSAHCAQRRVLGVRGLDGCAAERFVMPVKNLVVVPSHVDDDTAVFAEPLAAALHAAQQTRLEGKTYVSVLGDGVIALLCAQVMARRNASVRVLGSSERRLELAGKWGVKHRLEHEAGRRADQDVVIDCTGTPEGFSLALRLVRPRGTVLLQRETGPASFSMGDGAASPTGASPPSASLPGTHAHDSRAADAGIIAEREIEVRGTRCGQIAEAVAALAVGDLDVVSLLGARDRLDRSVEALRLAGGPDALAVLIEV